MGGGEVLVAREGYVRPQVTETILDGKVSSEIQKLREILENSIYSLFVGVTV